MVESLKILISVPGLIFLLLIAGAILVSTKASQTKAGKIMVGLALFLLGKRDVVAMLTIIFS